MENAQKFLDYASDVQKGNESSKKICEADMSICQETERERENQIIFRTYDVIIVSVLVQI